MTQNELKTTTTAALSIARRFGAGLVASFALVSASGCMAPMEGDLDAYAADDMNDEVGESVDFLLNGTSTTSYDPVVRIEYSYTSGNTTYYYRCTATAISDDTLVTAAHCIKEGTNVFPWIKVRKAHGANSGAEGRYSEYFVASQYMYDTWDNQGTLSESQIGRDIAFIKFGAKTFSSYYPLGTADSSIVGDTVRLLGFGGNDTKAYGDDVVSSYAVKNTDEAIMRMSQSNGGNLESGDSGGPVLLADGSGGWELVGVNSATSSSQSYHGAITTGLYNYLQPIVADFQDKYCVEFFKDSNYSGTSWSHCSETKVQSALDNTTFADPFKIADHDNVSYSQWNDEITSFTIPDKTILRLFQHSSYGGTALTFQNTFSFGNTSAVSSLSTYSFNDTLSSYAFSITSTSGAYAKNWRMEPTHFGKCFETDGANGSALIQKSCSSSVDNQTFKLQTSGSYHKIVHVPSGRCLAPQIDTVPGVFMVLKDCASTDSQLFTLTSNTTTSDARDFQIANKASGMCVTLQVPVSSDGLPFVQMPCSTGNLDQNVALKQYYPE